MKSRNVLIDYMKVIGMYLIILGHSNPPVITDIVYGVSVPLFFFLSGYLHRDHEWKALIEKTVLYMFLPVVLIMMVRNIVVYANSDIFEVVFATIKNSLLGYHGGRWGLLEGWFVYSLIVLLMMHKILGLKKFTMLLPALAVICCALSKYNIMFYNAVPNALLCSFLFVGGCWVSEFGKNPPLWYAAAKQFIDKNINLCFGLGAIVYCLSAHVNGAPWIWSNRYGNYFVLYLLTAFLGIFLVYKIAGWIKGLFRNEKMDAAVTLLSKGNLVVLCTHYPLIFVREEWMSLVGAGVLYACYIPVIWLILKYCPYIAGIRSKSKQKRVPELER